MNARKSKLIRDFRNRVLVLQDELLRFAQLQFGNILFRGHIELAPEQVLDSRARDREMNAQIFYRNRTEQIVVDINDDLVEQRAFKMLLHRIDASGLSVLIQHEQRFFQKDDRELVVEDRIDLERIHEMGQDLMDMLVGMEIVGHRDGFKCIFHIEVDGKIRAGAFRTRIDHMLLARIDDESIVLVERVFMIVHDGLHRSLVHIDHFIKIVDVAASVVIAFAHIKNSLQDFLDFKVRNDGPEFHRLRKRHLFQVAFLIVHDDVGWIGNGHDVEIHVRIDLYDTMNDKLIEVHHIQGNEQDRNSFFIGDINIG